jgi:outer membrane receptor for monomeric catechols
MTGVDPSTKYEKPRQDVGVFLLSHDFNFTLTLQDLMLWYISMIHILVSG